ncbi:N-acetylglucosaminyl-phosphatidylinositol de-N-acetylase-like [Dreissena polymorpha]|uniref:N-acetylglucosaminylphosphatidylinositol deacetylase n=1 Tax=Dreissena polymorpha TaxID=45954 RepID=A0A9D4L7L5_DREPO|nr:N-acetylglucosaminyl-phosphatidylinositol de-N-acetylase-like [Dreissena polymorpha]KAH3853283.1 hypothetical protein DPMN_095805 [Dreissena polymorpha]
MLAFLILEFLWPFAIVLVLCYVYIKCSAVNHFIRSGCKQNVLIVTAHPDDECMFFAPTILSLLQEGHQIYLVCLSKGNFYNQGELRKKELLVSCGKLGIPQSNVTIIEDERFQDGPENVWSIDGIVERVSGVIKRIGAKSVITFDGQGVSSHPNHVALFKAARRMVHEKVIEGVSVFVLESTNIVRKYVSIIDIPISSIICMTTFVSLPVDVYKAWLAMTAHKSQLVWFRKLYIFFSRYMYVNTLYKLD